jgi:hypothetical protein
MVESDARAADFAPVVKLVVSNQPTEPPEDAQDKGIRKIFARAKFDRRFRLLSKNGGE